MSKLMFNGRCYSYGGEPLMQPVIYSEEEREIGCWTDGRPLYARIIDIASVSFSQSAYNDYYASVNLSSYLNNISTLFIDVTASAYYMSGYPRAFRRWTFDNTNDTPRVELYIEANRSNMPVKLAVHYTKTTDQPGSGTWIPNGALATHYSTDEQVVGTWIDGSTVYEKVIETTFNNASPRYTLDLSTMDGTPITLIDTSNSFLYYNNNGTQIVQVATQAATNYTSSTLTYNHQQGAVTGKAYVTVRYTKTTS